MRFDSCGHFRTRSFCWHVLFSRRASFEKMKVHAKAEYLTAQAYDIQTLVSGKLSIFTIGGGFALELDNTQTYSAIPGISLLTGIQITRRLGMELSGTISLKPENILKLSGLKASGKSHTPLTMPMLGFNIPYKEQRHVVSSIVWLQKWRHSRKDSPLPYCLVSGRILL